MDHGWCFGYTCQKRLSTFWATASSGMTYAINATGTPARHFRIWQPYVPDGAEVVLHVNYFEPLRRYVWATGVGRLESNAAMPEIGDGSGHGAYCWDQVCTQGVQLEVVDCAAKTRLPEPRYCDDDAPGHFSKYGLGCVQGVRMCREPP